MMKFSPSLMPRKQRFGGSNEIEVNFCQHLGTMRRDTLRRLLSSWSFPPFPGAIDGHSHPTFSIHHHPQQSAAINIKRRPAPPPAKGLQLPESSVLETGSLRSMCQHGQVLMRTLCWVTDCCLLVASSHGVTVLGAVILYPVE
ncbi:uncharacterized protein AAEQ78_022073 [Lycaon pictus]